MSDALATGQMVKSFVTESTHGYPVLRVIGDVDFSSQPEFATALRGLEIGARTAAIVSFEDCTVVDSSIVGAVLASPERSWDVVIVTKPENPTNRGFDVVGLDRVYPVAHSLDEAVARAETLDFARRTSPENPACPLSKVRKPTLLL
jgi:anti-anti-sigma regulatory factor